MALVRLLKGPGLLSIANAVVGLAGVLIIVRLAGSAQFAIYTVDLVKLSLLGLLYELVPSAYVIIRSQKDQTTKADLASFCLVGMIASPVLIFAVGQTPIISGYSNWMMVYGAYLPIQRYLDVKLQSEGRLREYFQLGFLVGLFRLLFLGAAFALASNFMTSLDILWASLALGAFLSLVLAAALRRGDLAPFIRGNHVASIGRLVQARADYVPYYLNVGLKRVRDASITLVSSFVVGDQMELARYLLAFRGLEIVCAQLRVVEGLLMNVAARLAIAKTRARSFVILSVLGQGAAFVLSLVLAGWASADRALVLTSFVASLFVYPYVFELLRRADAYAASDPRRVTVSLAAFIIVLAATILVVRELNLLTAAGLMLAPLLGQTAAALTYLAPGRKAPPTRASGPS